MSENIGRFRRLIISDKALQQEHGHKLFERFTKRNLETFVLEDDNSVLSHPLEYHPLTLLILFSPTIGCITPAEHGILATRSNEFYLHPIIGCQSACTYCYLLSSEFQRDPLRFFVGVDDLFVKLDELLSDTTSLQKLLFCTGELADSLAEVDLYPIAPILIEHFAHLRRARLELRTKSAKINQVLLQKHNGNTTIAFSIAPQSNVTRFEPLTASLTDRLVAARQCQDVGYPVALKMEPIIPTQDWEKSYEDMIRAITATLDVNAIEHISIGSLRWSKELAEQPIFNRQYASIVKQGDWIEHRDRKFNGTITFDERVKIYSKIQELLCKYGFNAPVWWSLEEPRIIDVLESRYHCP